MVISWHNFSLRRHQLLFSNASMVRGEKWQERKFRLNSLQHNSDFQRTWDRSRLKTLKEKEKMLVTSIFSFSNNVFYPSQYKFQLFSHIYFVICKFFQFGPVKKFVICYRVNWISNLQSPGLLGCLMSYVAEPKAK